MPKSFLNIQGNIISKSEQKSPLGGFRSSISYKIKRISGSNFVEIFILLNYNR